MQVGKVGYGQLRLMENRGMTRELRGATQQERSHRGSGYWYLVLWHGMAWVDGAR